MRAYNSPFGWPYFGWLDEQDGWMNSHCWFWLVRLEMAGNGWFGWFLAPKPTTHSNSNFCANATHYMNKMVPFVHIQLHFWRQRPDSDIQITVNYT